MDKLLIVHRVEMMPFSVEVREIGGIFLEFLTTSCHELSSLLNESMRRNSNLFGVPPLAKYTSQEECQI